MTCVVSRSLRTPCRTVFLEMERTSSPDGVLKNGLRNHQERCVFVTYLMVAQAMPPPTPAASLEARS
jgi:hypothetical protein